MESNTTYFSNALNSTLQNIRIAEEFHHTKGHYEVRLRCTIAICVVNFLLCFTALFGNSAIILTIWKKSSLHCAANILLTSLAVSDFAVGLISHPLFIANLLMRIRYFSIPPRLLWVSFNVLTTFLSSVSFLTVTAIGMDRLLALQLHLRYRTVVTHFRVRCVIIFIWVYSGALSSVGAWSLVAYYKAVSPVIVAFLVGNFFIYLRIYLVVRRHQRQIQQQLLQPNNSGNNFCMKIFKKTAINTFLVYILLLCCYIPQCFVSLALFSSDWRFSFTAETITGTIVLLNSSLNPILYYWRISKMRRALIETLCCQKTTTETEDYNISNRVTANTNKRCIAQSSTRILTGC